METGLKNFAPIVKNPDIWVDKCFSKYVYDQVQKAKGSSKPSADSNAQSPCGKCGKSNHTTERCLIISTMHCMDGNIAYFIDDQGQPVMMKEPESYTNSTNYRSSLIYQLAKYHLKLIFFLFNSSYKADIDEAKDRVEETRLIRVALGGVNKSRGRFARSIRSVRIEEERYARYCRHCTYPIRRRAYRALACTRFTYYRFTPLFRRGYFYERRRALYRRTVPC
ncbi:unnamed protein product [Trichogramma brassicae]|uniref:Uncharacterized protein n=1 Tax=Trichogramma brassicae TaxID=86971 RepID=A0A6H5ICN4_9HYME|nr:unnamed protein product [Trichogramma brassicae]